VRINRIRIPSVRRLATEITVRRQRTPPGDLGVYLCLEVVVGKEPRWGSTWPRILQTSTS
jgi:hypothetical protein